MLRRARSSAFAIASATALLFIAADPPRPAETTVILKGGTVVDGTGAPARKADLAFRGERIVAVGEIEPKPGDRVIDVSGLVVAPGFIDLHNHSDAPIVNENTRDNRNYQAQGVTTVVTGNCGAGALDVAKYFETINKHGAGTNVIHLIPQGDVREAVLGTTERKPDAAQLRAMKALVEKGMRAGAWGMSSGLIYVPSRYADTKELIELSKVVAAHGGIYASHIRDEGAGLLGSIREAVDVGKGAGLPVHISHLKVTGKKNWGLTKDACDAIEAARAMGLKVTADQYPYIASSTSLSAMVVPHWAAQGNAVDFARIADDHIQGAKLRAAIQEELADRDGGASIRIARHGKDPSIVGLDLAEIARRRGSSVLDVVIDIQRNGGAQAISFGMGEDDVRQVMKNSYVATASDGSAHRPGGGDKPHPRAYGTFPRKFRYALDDKLMTLEQAVRSCSGLPAEILGLPDRGTIRVGNVADLVVFDPKTFRDASTWDEPTRYASGVKYLFVNGIAAVSDGKPQKARPGRALRLDKDGPAQTILKVGRIWTGDPANPRAQAVAIRDGALVAVGSAAEAERFRGPHTRLIDHPTGFAMPGLIDAHGHMESLGASREQVDLRGVSSLEEVARRVQARIESVPGDGWIIGNSFDQSRYPGGAFPDASTLDAVAPSRPVLLRRLDGHAIWVNSEAMRRAKVTKETATPAGGQVFRDKDGHPTGIFVDGAMGLIYPAVPDPARRPRSPGRLLAAQVDCPRVGPGPGRPRRGRRQDRDRRLPDDRPRRPAQDADLRDGEPGREGSRSSSSAGPVPQGWQGKRPFPYPFHQALHRRRDGLARRPPLRTLQRRFRQLGPPTDRGDDPPRDDDGRPQTRLAGEHPRDRRQGEFARPRRLRRGPEGGPRGARRPAADRARAGRPQGRRRAVQGAGRDRLDAALARERRHALGRRPARPRPRPGGLRLALVPRRGRAARLRQRLPRRGRESLLRPLRRRHPPGRDRLPARRLAPRPAPDPRRSPPRLHRGLGLCGVRGGKGRRPQGRHAGGYHRRRPRPVRRQADRLCSTQKVTETIVDGDVAFEDASASASAGIG